MTPHDDRPATVAARKPAPAQTAAPAVAPDSTASVLYVHGTVRHRPAVRDRLARLGSMVTIASDIAEAMRLVSERRFDVGILDLADDRGALAAIRMLRTAAPALPLAGIVDPTSPATAAEALHAGLAEVLAWPFDDRDVMTVVANARDRVAIDARHAAASRPVGGLFAQSPVMRQVLEAVRAAAVTRRGLLVVGEPGTGRELVARAIHAQGVLQPREFVRVDCTAAPAVLEAELFGAATERPDDGRHADTGSISTASAIYRAHGGTLFLANLTEMAARVQSRLARLLRDREATLGESGTLVDLDVRLIAAVDPDVDAAIEDGRLRRELADRFSPSRLDVPPLRGRRDDIPLLTVHFAKEACDRLGVPVKSISRAALAVLAALPWHGNAHELRALVEALVGAVARPVIQLDDVLDHAELDGMSTRIDRGVTLRDAKARFERECISAVLIRHHGRVGEAAKALGIQRTNLYRKVRQLNVARSLLSAKR